MAPSYVLAIDQGTTSTRAILFDKDGQPKAMEQQEFPQYYPQPGWTEHDPLEILRSAVECSEGAMKKVGASKDDIAGIGITNQRETTVAWDKGTGEPLCRAIVWLDLRTSDTAAELEAKGGKDRFRKKTGLPVSTYFSAVKMKWMLDNVPEVRKAADEGRCCFGTIESWIIYKLTGGPNGGVHVTDVSNASRYMLMNINTCAWDEAVCSELGIPVTALPTIRSNSEVYGKVSSVPSLEGLAISGALGDQHAALLGHGCLDVGTSKNTYGTVLKVQEYFHKKLGSRRDFATAMIELMSFAHQMANQMVAARDEWWQGFNQKELRQKMHDTVEGFGFSSTKVEVQWVEARTKASLREGTPSFVLFVKKFGQSLCSAQIDINARSAASRLIADSGDLSHSVPNSCEILELQCSALHEVGCFMLLNTGGDAVPSKHGLLTTIGYQLGPEEKVTYALEGSVACVGRVVQWLRDNLGIISSSKDVETLAGKVEDTGGLTLVPAFSGLFAPHWRDDARAVAVGMTLFTSKEHMCRAALESTAFQAVDIMEAMKQDTGLRILDMRVDGGMTVNSLLMQMQADILGMSVLRSKLAEATALGAALAAGLSVGFYQKKEVVKDIIEKAGGYEVFPASTTPAARRKMMQRWKDAVERSFDLAKFDPKRPDQAKPAVLKKPRFVKVSSVKPEQKGLNLQLKVVKLPEEVASDGYHDVVCGDASGVVTCHLTPQQFLPCEAGSYIRVQNARVRMKGGHIRVEVDKWGKVSQADSATETFEVNLQNDISAVEYELRS
eukprot:s1761_g5.t2